MFASETLFHDGLDQHVSRPALEGKSIEVGVEPRLPRRDEKNPVLEGSVELDERAKPRSVVRATTKADVLEVDEPESESSSRVVETYIARLQVAMIDPPGMPFSDPAGEGDRTSLRFGFGGGAELVQVATSHAFEDEPAQVRPALRLFFDGRQRASPERA